MGYKIIETELARQDLSDIVDHILNALENPPAVATFLDEVEACYDNLEQYPLMFEACRGPHLEALGYRKAVIRNYIMLYKVSEPTRTVSVMRFFHGRQDYQNLL